MFLRSLFPIFIILIFVFTIFGEDKNFTKQILPDKISGWELSGETEKFRGEDLFLFINGGAEIYHEYGFREATSGVYKKKGFKPVNAEIYEMDDPFAAFGIYSFKSGSGGKNIEVGNDSSLEGYYLNFWKGNYLVTLTGFDEEKKTTEGIISIARKIDRSIKIRGTKPPLVKLLNMKSISELKYLKGNLGLYNIYPFSTDNIFKVKKCVTAIYKKGQIFVFRYIDSEEKSKILKQAVFCLSKPDRYSVVKRSENKFITKDKSGKYIFLHGIGNHIIVFISDSITAGEKALQEIKVRLNDSGLTMN